MAIWMAHRRGVLDQSQSTSQMSAAEDEVRRKYEKPVVDEALARKVLSEHYGMNGIDKLSDLESYDDRNFRVELTSGEVFTLKFHNGVETDNRSVIEAQDHVLRFLCSRGVVCPSPQKSMKGDFIIHVNVCMTGNPSEQKAVATRLLGWVHGTPMNQLESISETLIRQAGCFLGKMRVQLDTFDHPGAHRVHQWDLIHTAEIEKYMDALQKADQKQLVRGIINEFKGIQSKLRSLRHGVLQADFNDANIIVQEDRVAGVIDFGDLVHSARVNDVAIAIAYMMLTKRGREKPIDTGCVFLSGFCAEYALLPSEIELLYTLVCCRLAISVTIGAYSYMQQPENEYLLLHAQPAWDVLTKLRSPTVEVDAITRRFLSCTQSS